MLLGGDDFGGAIDSVVIDVAEVGDFDVGDLQEGIAMIEAAAQAHHADQQLVAGRLGAAQDSGRGDSGSGREGAGLLDETSAGQ